MAKLVAAKPAYGLGDVVAYKDHQGRLQSGEVLAVEASWRWGTEPLVIYTLKHPTYRNNRYYAGVSKIVRRLSASGNGG